MILGRHGLGLQMRDSDCTSKPHVKKPIDLKQPLYLVTRSRPSSCHAASNPSSSAFCELLRVSVANVTLSRAASSPATDGARTGVRAPLFGVSGDPSAGRGEGSAEEGVLELTRTRRCLGSGHSRAGWSESLASSFPGPGGFKLDVESAEERDAELRLSCPRAEEGFVAVLVL
eukprot:2383814-Rhodomonas_salina.1